MVLTYINLFTIVNNIELYPYKGSQIVRSAGTSAIITGKINNKMSLKLKSGWNIYISEFCMSTLGRVSNITHNLKKFKKAGDVVNLGKRPIVRGVAMNPCDHPHGGGEGKKSPPASPVSPWGWFTQHTPSKKKSMIY